jgi:uncharacterized protein involved in exopolysaccharide biosynthesis/Mrp family chromosome partitioning ATPase
MNTTAKEPDAQTSLISLDDIWFILFRRKWLIAAFAAAGLAGALALNLTEKPVYRSTAKLWVRYVMDSRMLNPIGSEREVISLDKHGQSIINSEIEILKSWDLVLRVVDSVGADKILAKTGGGSNQLQAVGLVVRGLQVMPSAGSVISVSCGHPDGELAQVILKELIDRYMERHIEIHREVGVFDFLSQQTDQLRAQLMQTEDELRKFKSQNGISSIEDTKDTLAAQQKGLRGALLNAEVELAGHKARLEERAKWLKRMTNASPGDSSQRADELTWYRSVCDRLMGLRFREFEMLARFTEDNPLIENVRKQIASMAKEKQRMEDANPDLALLGNSGATAAQNQGNPFEDVAQIAVVEARTGALNSQLERLRAEVAAFDQIENALLQLQRKKDLEEANYRYFSASLERARVDVALDSGRHSNISVAQSPSPPIRDSKDLRKVTLKVLAAGAFGGIALAFILELFVFQTLKRPSEVERKVGLPLLTAIPYVNGEGRLVAAGRLTDGTATSSSEGRGIDQTGALPWKEGVKRHFEALRDQVFLSLSGSAGSRVLAVGACAKGAGVTTVATGLALALSDEAANGVLLIDVSRNEITTHFFRKGRLSDRLAAAVSDDSNVALVQQSLYLLLEGKGASGAPALNLVQRISNLIPELKRSNCDYVVFDMPPLSQSGMLLRLAGLMDRVLLVVEAEKTSREAVRGAKSALSDAKGRLAVVLNKFHRRVPAWLQQE